MNPDDRFIRGKTIVAKSLVYMFGVFRLFTRAPLQTQAQQRFYWPQNRIVSKSGNIHAI
jgi:hypothetical protein